VQLYDISVPIEPAMAVWPGDPGVGVTRVLDCTKGDPATVSNLALGAHTGTHVDAFSHFIPGAASLDQMTLSRYIGRALVVSIPETVQSIDRSLLDQALAAQQIDPSTTPIERILFKTRNSTTLWSQAPFNPTFTHIAPTGADRLIELGVQLVGMDYLSVEGYGVTGAPTHHRLMTAGVYIVEGLYLGEVPPGWYELICLPLSITGADGAPARAILRTVHQP
jgi:arylformamidase